MAAALAGREGIEAAELAIRAGLTRLGRGVLEDLLAAGAGHRGPAAGCGAGHQAQFVSYRDKTVDTVLGPVTVRRAWYHCGACGHGFAPRDGELGVAGETMSPGLAKMSARAAAAVPFTPGAGLAGELAGITLTGRRLGRRAEADGTAAAAATGAQAAAITARTLIPLPPAPLPDMLYIAIDGTGVPMTAAETEGRDGKGDDGKARTREVKLCCCFTQTTTDEDGCPVRDPGSSSYLATFAPAAPSGTLMAAEARRRGAGHVRQLAVLGDGAVWIWNLAAGTSPKPPRSPACSTPASTCTTWPGCWSSCSAVTTTPGSPGASLSSTPATSRHCCQPPASSRWPARKPRHWTPPWATSRPTPTACATSISAHSACSPAPEPWRRPSQTAEASNSSCSSLLVTHPFHPLRGQRLTVLYDRRLAGIGHVYICDAGSRGTLALPPGYTDRGGEPGSLVADVRVLAELARVLRAVQGR